MGVKPICTVGGCDIPTKSSLVCGKHRTELERALGNVAALVADAEVTGARLGRSDDAGGRGSAERPIPVDLRAREVLWALGNTLGTWLRVVAELVEASPPVAGPVCPVCPHGSCAAIRWGWPVTPAPIVCQARDGKGCVVHDGHGSWPADHPASMAAWLLLHVAELLRLPAAGEAVDEITAAVRSVERLVDRRADELFAGPCNAPPQQPDDGCGCGCHRSGDRRGCSTCGTADGGHVPVCGADVWARPGSAFAWCQRCRWRYDVAQRRDWLLAAVEHVLVSATDLARAVSRLGALDEPITPSMVRNWADRGMIVAHGVDGQGRPLYRVGEVLDTAAQVAARRETRRQRRGA